LDVHEVLAHPRWNDPEAAALTQGGLAQSIALPLDKRAAAQQNINFSVAREYRRQLADGVAPAFRQDVRPAAAGGRSELFAGDELGLGMPFYTHGANKLAYEST